MMKKKILSALTAVMCAASIAAVPTVSAEGAGRNFTYKGSLKTGGDKLTILCWSSDIIQQRVDMWLEDTGYTDEQVEVVDFSSAGGNAPELYCQYIENGGEADIMLLEPDWALELLNDDKKTAALSELGFNDGNFADQYSYTREIGKDSKGVFKGVSIDVAPGVWCYRTDLAEKYLGVKTPDEMQAKVRSAMDFSSAAETVAEASSYETAISATLDGVFAAIRNAKSKPWLVDGKYNKEWSDASLSMYAKVALTLTSKGLVTDKEMWTTEWIDLGQTDETMGYFVPSWGFGDTLLLSASGGENGETYGKWGVCEGPAPYYWGGNMICVSPETDNADMAADFIDYFAVNKETMKKYALESGTEQDEYGLDYLPNSMTVVQELINEGTDRDKVIDDMLGGQERLAVLDKNAKAINQKYENITPYDSRIEADLMTAVKNYCDGITETDKEFIDDFKGMISEYIDMGVIIGDISGNGKIDLYDAIQIAESLIGKRKFTEAEIKIADYNGDGKVDLYDAIGIAVYMVTHKG